MSSHNNHDAGSVKQYVVGFIISIILTVIPFGMVMGGMPKGITVAALVITMFAQVWVQLVFFLHMKREDAQRWHIASFWYTFLTIAILFVGSVWILSELHSFMM